MKLEVADEVAQVETKAVKTTRDNITKNNVDVETEEVTQVEKDAKTQLHA